MLQVLDVADGNTDVDAIRKAVEEAKAVTDKPSIVVTHTLIGYGSPNKVNSYAAHGAPLGADETDLTRKELKWPYSEFEVPDEVYSTMRDQTVPAGEALEKQWNADYAEYKDKYPDLAKEYESIMTGELPVDWDECLPTFTPKDKGLATRQHSQTLLNAIAPALPGFIGGSADLAGSNLTIMKMFGDFQKTSYAERNMRYGVREHGMGSISNGVFPIRNF
jgi:transketolase